MTTVAMSRSCQQSRKRGKKYRSTHKNRKSVKRENKS